MPIFYCQLLPQGVNIQEKPTTDYAGCFYAKAVTFSLLSNVHAITNELSHDAICFCTEYKWIIDCFTCLNFNLARLASVRYSNCHTVIEYGIQLLLHTDSPAY